VLSEVRETSITVDQYNILFTTTSPIVREQVRVAPSILNLSSPKISIEMHGYLGATYIKYG